MPVWFITGRLGSGKSLIGVKKAQEYLLRDRPVATNMDLYLDKLVPSDNRTANLVRLPDKPSADDINSLGNAYEGAYDESKFGFMLLDELGSWLNSRSWNDKQRQPFIDTCIHLRKRYWDVAFLVQDISMVDAQVRQALCEYLVVCKRTDRIKIPGTNINAPKMHVASVYYGDTPKKELKEDTWIYKGTGLYDAYDTTQAFSPFYPHGNMWMIPPAMLKPPEITTSESNSMGFKTFVSLSVLIAIIGAAVWGVSNLMGGADVLLGLDADNEVSQAIDQRVQESKTITAAKEQATPEPINPVMNHHLEGFTYYGYMSDGRNLLLIFEDNNGFQVTYDEGLFNALGYEVLEAANDQLVATSDGRSVVFRGKAP